MGIGVRVVVDAASRPAGVAPTTVEVVVDQLQRRGTPPRVASAYGGLGVWVDAFDLSPTYAGDDPPVTSATVDDWAEAGVRTVYVQAARMDERSPGVLLEEDALAALLLRAHAADMLVIAWYLPTFADVEADLAKLLAVAEFDALGHRFDGVAVDIEYIEAVPDPVERSARLVDLSERLRGARPGEALGAIVPPAVQLEVVNPSYWPTFPWAALDASYDVWLPMAYWTTRAGSRYADPYAYTEESVRRMRANVGRDVLVHPIGGIGDALAPDDLTVFRQALTDVGAIGGSVYDWASMSQARRAELADLVPE